MKLRILRLTACLLLLGGVILAPLVRSEEDTTPKAEIIVNKDLQIHPISDHLYWFSSWAEIGKWGRVGSNGMIVVNNGEAYLIDTPMHEQQTIELVDWIEKNLKVKLVGFTPGHWHDDCVGGLAYLNKRGIKTLAGERTNALLKEHCKETAKETFENTTTVTFHGYPFTCVYLGGGHSTDNIVVWFPKDKVLFGGCLIKDAQATNLGNLEDAAPLEEWMSTIGKIEARFSEAKMIVPGHGEPSNSDAPLLKTKELLKQALQSKTPESDSKDSN